MDTTDDGAEAVTEPQDTTPAAPDAPVINGAELFDEVERYLRRFIILPSSHAYVATALWLFHTHAYEAFDVTPRLAVLGKVKECGKTLLMDLLVTMAARPEFLADLTGPVLFTMIAADKPTIFFDETDEFFGKAGKGGKSQVRTIANVGYRRGAQIARMYRGAVEKYPVFAPMAFAGIGQLPDTLQSRCVVIEMRKRRPGEKCDRYIPRFHAPLGQQIGKAIGAWVMSVGAELATAEPELPADVSDRPAELWWTLLSVADQIGGTVPERAREACVALVHGDSQGENDAQPPVVQLLADMAAVWPTGADRMSTADLVRALLDLPGAQWAAMWSPMTMPREMAALLEPHGIRPTKVRVGGKPVQGYFRPAQIPEAAAEEASELTAV